MGPTERVRRARGSPPGRPLRPACRPPGRSCDSAAPPWHSLLHITVAGRPQLCVVPAGLDATLWLPRTVSPPPHRGPPRRRGHLVHHRLPDQDLRLVGVETHERNGGLS